jgi:hypothetical protein
MKIKSITAAALAAIILTGCANTGTTATSAAPANSGAAVTTAAAAATTAAGTTAAGTTAAGTTAAGATTAAHTTAALVDVTLIADKTAGATTPQEKEYKEKIGEVNVVSLANALSQLTGLKFHVTAEIKGKNAHIDWAKDSTLVAGMGDTKANEEFHMFDAVSTNWFMMDSLEKTVKKNLNIDKVYYSMNGGKTLEFKNAEDMKAQGLPELPADSEYMGSTFYVSHSGNR